MTDYMAELNTFFYEGVLAELDGTQGHKTRSVRKSEPGSRGVLMSVALILAALKSHFRAD